ncbi:hypothetical protein CH333_06660, partial [candidate division WOR-3 bacterium JGI_Cruoil_03_44_89]
SLGDTLWTHTYGGSDWDAAYSVQNTPDGGFVIVGFTASYGAGSADVYLIRTDSLGDTLWTHTYGGSDGDKGWFVQNTPDGGYVITGDTWSYGAGIHDVYLIRTDSLGDTLWTHTYGGSVNDCGYSVQNTPDGGYIIVGETNSYGAGVFDVYLVKTDSLGDTLWTHTYGGSDWDAAYSVQNTPDGGFVIAGLTDYHGVGSGDVYLIKTDSFGDTTWTKTYGGSDVDRGECVQNTCDGGYIIAGYTYSYGVGSIDVYLIKTDETGSTGVEEVNHNSLITDYPPLKVYPNPFVWCCCTASSGHNLLHIYDLSGRLIETTKSNIIGKDLNVGIYFIEANGYKPVKVVKVR